MATSLGERGFMTTSGIMVRSSVEMVPLKPLSSLLKRRYSVLISLGSSEGGGAGGGRRRRQRR
jgi:hypothetical protein